MHVISDCNTHMFSDRLQWNNSLSDAQLYLVKNSFVANFVSRTILAVIAQMQEHIFLDFSDHSYSP